MIKTLLIEIFWVPTAHWLSDWLGRDWSGGREEVAGEDQRRRRRRWRPPVLIRHQVCRVESRDSTECHTTPHHTTPHHTTPHSWSTTPMVKSQVSSLNFILYGSVFSVLSCGKCIVYHPVVNVCPVEFFVAMISRLFWPVFRQWRQSGNTNVSDGTLNCSVSIWTFLCLLLSIL